MVNILVVEDNEITRKSLVKTIQKTLVNCTIFESGTGKHAISLLETNHMDLFFLDIELPDINGMEVATKIRSIEKYEFANIVFITTYITLLPKALQEYHCYDFIEKPFKMEKIVETLNKLIRGIHKEELQEKKKYITITNGIVTNKILLKELYYIEIQNRYILFHSKSGIYKEGNISLKQLVFQLQKLEVTNFVRAHKSYVVNIDYILRIEQITRSSGNIIFDNYDGIALIGETYKEDIYNKFKWGD